MYSSDILNTVVTYASPADDPTESARHDRSQWGCGRVERRTGDLLARLIRHEIERRAQRIAN